MRRVGDITQKRGLSHPSHAAAIWTFHHRAQLSSQTALFSISSLRKLHLWLFDIKQWQLVALDNNKHKTLGSIKQVPYIDAMRCLSIEMGTPQRPLPKVPWASHRPSLVPISISVLDFASVCLRWHNSQVDTIRDEPQDWQAGCAIQTDDQPKSKPLN